MKQGFYVSKNYRSNTAAASKAKIDCEDIFIDYGLKNIGLKRTISDNTGFNFFRNLVSAIVSVVRLPRKSNLILQYPFKKYYPFISFIARCKGCKVVTLIHDLRSHRKGNVTIKEEIRLLNHSEVVIVHNEEMKKWMEEHGSTSRLVCLGIFDYLSKDVPKKIELQKPYRLVFAGALSKKKNPFLYEFPQDIENYKLSIYGRGVNEEVIENNPTLDYGGFFNADELISKLQGHFGLVWDGTSTTTCAGQFGEYLKYNNPHKTSLYIRCHLPIITWSQAAIGKFVKDNNIGVLVDSLLELEDVLKNLNKEEYQMMLVNTQKIAENIKSGFYLKKALADC